MNDKLAGMTCGRLVRHFRETARPTASELWHRQRALTRAAGAGGLAAPEAQARARRRTGLTQEELAARCGLSMEGLRKIERDRVCPHSSTVRALAKALHLTATEQELLHTAAERKRVMREQSRTVPRWPGALPVPLTTFVGHRATISAVAALLDPGQPSSESSTSVPPRRLVTLTGPGGCGKTRLAVARTVDDVAA